MVQEREPKEGRTISTGVWSAQLYDHIKYFNSYKDLRELEIVLPFGIPRERKPPNYEKDQLEAKGVNPNQAAMMRRIATTRLGQFYTRPEAEIEPWSPRLKPVRKTNDQVQNKPALFILRHDPAEKKVMYIEQDLMAKPITTKEIDKQSGFTYRLVENRSVIVRKYLALVKEAQLENLVREFIKECNRVLYLYCDTR